ncbi:MAG: hypothetical protein KDB14_11270 [Planctomycetales bacterium]|nr:hypothetical protein [Planctomycetales bacterium]
MPEIPSEHRRLFPLTLPPIDLLFFYDDFPDYPMSFYIELEFSGSLDRERMNAALDEALSRHPLLFSRVLPGKRNRPSWTPAPELATTIRWRNWGEPLLLAEGEEFIDLRNDTGLRIWGEHDEQHCKLTMQFHHATCDGTGAYRFIGDLLVGYFQRTPEGADQVELGDTDWGRLRHRRSAMGDLSERVGVWKLLPTAISQYRQMLRLVKPLRPPAQKPAQRPFPNLAVETLSPEVLTELRQQAVERSAMLNDLLICEFFRAIQEWNGGGGTLRMMVPSDMRDKSYIEMPAANMTAYTFITRKARQVGAEDLLDTVRRDTLEIKGGKPQRRFMDSLAVATGGPSWFRFVMRQNFSLATAVLSNAGDPSRRFTGRLPKRRGVISCGGLTLEGITGAPPVRRKTRASLSVSSYARKLALTVRCDPNLYSLADSQQFLSVYTARLKQLAGA